MSIFFNLQRNSEGKKRVVDYLSREYGDVGVDILAFVPENAILCNVGPLNRQEVITRLSQKIAKHEMDTSSGLIYEAIHDREALGSTVVDGGIAFPHARTEDVSTLYIAVATSKEGFDFGEDGKVHIVFLLVSNDDYATTYLLALAALARIVRNPENREKLKNTEKSIEVKEILLGSRLSTKSDMTIGELMKSPKILLDPEIPLAKVGYLLEEHELDCAFVTDDSRILLGEINDLDLLRVSAADFFSGEEHQGLLLARDAMQTKIPILKEDDRIADAAMKMVDLRRNRLPVVDEQNRVVGEVIWTDLIGKMMQK